MKRKGLALAGLMLLGGGAQAAGFALIEQSASGLGNAYAGQAASAQDASVLFYNPAGLNEIQGRQFVAAVHLIKPSARYSASAGVEDGGDAGSLIPVPSAYYAMDISPDLKFGLGMGAPFGLKTEYDSDWSGRSHAILSDLQSVSLSPTLAWRLSDAVSLGVGVNYSYIQAELSKGLPSPYSLLYPTVVTTMKGDDTAWSYNLGAMFRLGSDTRLGLGYRSTVKYHLSGQVTSNVDPALAQLGIPTNVYADVKLPDTATLAIHHQVNDRWSVMADATWTGWGAFNRLDIRRQSDGALVDSTDESWKDVWRFGLGASYRMNDTWTWRVGVAYDNAPVPDSAHRTPRIPDADRTWLAMGGQYALSGKGKVDFGYAHLFVKDSAIDNPAGSYDNAVDILSVQYTHTF
ncbi:MAG: outer membrane protein transport protein [Gallionellaceae bacterium]|nr:outer membrane protein transport protein [Gallionellaceae bacterium]